MCCDKDNNKVEDPREAQADSAIYGQTASQIKQPTELEEMEQYRDSHIREGGKLQQKIDFLKRDPKFAMKLNEYHRIGRGLY